MNIYMFGFPVIQVTLQKTEATSKLVLLYVSSHGVKNIAREPQYSITILYSNLMYCRLDVLQLELNYCILATGYFIE